MNSQNTDRILGKFLDPSNRSAVEDLDLIQAVQVLWRGKALIVAAALFFFGLSWSYVNHVAVPKYTAEATVVFNPQQSSFIDLESAVATLGGDQLTVNTEMEILSSRRLIGLLAERMDLLNDPEFNPYISEVGPVPSIEVQRKVVKSNLLEVLSVRNVSTSYVFSITALTTDPKKSADLVNTLADLYVADQLQVKYDATALATTWLTERVANLKAELEANETAIQAFAAATALVSPEALEGLSRQIKDLRSRIANLADERLPIDERLIALTRAVSQGDLDAMAEAAQDSALSRLVARGADADALSRAEVVIDQINAELARTDAQVASLTKSVAELEADYESQSADLVQLEQMRRERDASRSLFEFFLARLKETTVQQGIQQSDSRVLSYADLEVEPTEPRKVMIVALATLVGLSVGAGTVLLREARNSGFRTADQLQQATGQVVLGQIPKLRTRRRKRVVNYLIENQSSAAAEAVRNLRTSLVYADIKNPPKVIVSTSAIPGEGKTTVAIALALNFAGMGKRVLLIEGDTRRQVFGEYFKIAEHAGLLTVLAGEDRFEDVVQRIDNTDVDVLVAGKSARNAADLLASDRFSKLISGLRQRYDVVIIDVPPVLAVPDTRIVAQVADAVLFTVRWDYTSRAQVAEAIRQFELGGPKITGLVLTQIDQGGMRRYGYGGKYGAYGDYSKKYYDT